MPTAPHFIPRRTADIPKQANRVADKTWGLLKNTGFAKDLGDDVIQWGRKVKPFRRALGHVSDLMIGPDRGVVRWPLLGAGIGAVDATNLWPGGEKPDISSPGQGIKLATSMMTGAGLASLGGWTGSAMNAHFVNTKGMQAVRKALAASNIKGRWSNNALMDMVSKDPTLQGIYMKARQAARVTPDGFTGFVRAAPAVGIPLSMSTIPRKLGLIASSASGKIRDAVSKGMDAVDYANDAESGKALAEKLAGEAGKQAMQQSQSVIPILAQDISRKHFPALAAGALASLVARRLFGPVADNIDSLRDDPVLPYAEREARSRRRRSLKFFLGVAAGLAGGYAGYYLGGKYLPTNAKLDALSEPPKEDGGTGGGTAADTGAISTEEVEKARQERAARRAKQGK